jgi:hypothetical protein
MGVIAKCAEASISNKAAVVLSRHSSGIGLEKQRKNQDQRGEQVSTNRFKTSTFTVPAGYTSMLGNAKC